IAKIEFKVYLNDPARGPNVDAATLPVQAEYLESGKSFPDKQRDSLDFYTERKVGPSEPQLHVYKVEQKLDPRYAPVKRLERLELSYPPHRFANRPLQATAFSQKAIDEAGANAAAAGEAGGPGAVPSPDSRGDAGRGPLGVGGPMGMASTELTPNGLA